MKPLATKQWLGACCLWLTLCQELWNTWILNDVLHGLRWGKKPQGLDTIPEKVFWELPHFKHFQSTACTSNNYHTDHTVVLAEHKLWKKKCITVSFVLSLIKKKTQQQHHPQLKWDVGVVKQSLKLGIKNDFSSWLCHWLSGTSKFQVWNFQVE